MASSSSFEEKKISFEEKINGKKISGKKMLVEGWNATNYASKRVNVINMQRKARSTENSKEPIKLRVKSFWIYTYTLYLYIYNIKDEVRACQEISGIFAWLLRLSRIILNLIADQLHFN